MVRKVSTHLMFEGVAEEAKELSCPSVRFNARVGTGTEDACLWINGDGRVRT